MPDATLAYLEARDLGHVEQRIALRGKLRTESGARAPAVLCRTSSGLYLVAAKSRDEGRSVDLLARSELRYEHGTLGDRLVISDAELGVPGNQRRETRLAIGIARLRRQGTGAAPALRAGRHVAELGALERAFLEGFLEGDELLLAWQKTDHDAPVESRIAPGTTGFGYFLVSDRRAARVVLSAFGDTRVEPLDGVRVWLDDTLSGADLVIGRMRLKLARGEVELFREILAALELPRPARLRELARHGWLGRQDHAALTLCRALLDRGVRDGDPLATAAAFMVSCDLGEPNPAAPDVDTLVPALGTHHLPAEAVGTTWDEWKLSPEAAMVLLDQLRRHGDLAEPWALGLHERLHARLEDLRRDPKRQAKADLELAEHLIAAGHRERAVGLLERRIEALPSEELEDLVPRGDADLTAGDGGQVTRIRVFELLAEARKSGALPDLRATLELARLEPLVVRRLRALADVAEGSAKERALAVLTVLEPGGLRRTADVAGSAVANTLSSELLRDVLPHPVAREGSALLNRIQALLAAVPAPDHRMLLEYVEPIGATRQPEAAAALARAAHMLGAEGIQGFVSRGKKGVGLRGYEGPPPFVLVGGRHLDDDAEFGMTSDELAFAIATEVAHVRFGHARVTSNEVWTGLFEKSKQGLDFVLDVLPLFKGYRIAERAYQMLSRIPESTLKRVVGGAQAMRKRLTSRPDVSTEHKSDDVLSTVHEDLVAAARVMQLTADRAGLVLTGNLAAALRAMLLVRPDYKAELALAEAKGIEAVLAERDDTGQVTHQALAVRIAALVSFYLSDDYARLRGVVVG